ncbi:mechanosensitive ion channel family protein [Marivirga harenae]|uniref:mechanosensitive ion channel family protein n=1 Tax=Marivirga harenae TaxID=2010992 RepID=UPI0026E037AE|nr:mechanosensitive ion channel family protein [Marivirga harenae]WKV11301.1 mechanosensitive ion channel family protein [Marivirga harenae]|tara:strand:+ start:37516 stop:38451 length:936 start_codon:yes stop_codon:yes gene_type:complete
MQNNKIDSVKTELSEPLQVVTSKIDSWMDILVDMIPNMLLSVILLILFLVIAKFSRKVFIKIFQKSSDNKALENLFATIIYYAMLGIGLFIILDILNLDKAVTSLLAGVGVVGLALGFAFQDIAANFVSGVILAFRKPFLIDDVIQLGDLMGEVSRTNLRVTVIRTFQGQEVYVPNKDVLSNPITNYSVLKQRRIDLAVGVSYGDNLKKVKDLVLSTLDNLEDVIRKDEMIFTYAEFGSSSINFEIKFWIEYPINPSYLEMRSKAIMAIKEAFDKNDITIPFPIRTLDFGIKGGEKLSEMNIGSSRGLGSK